MSEHENKAQRRKQVRAIKMNVEPEQTGRGVHLPGLWACRAAAGLSQRDLALEIGTNQATVHELERLNRGAYPKTIRRLCAALDVEPVDLICAEAVEEE